MPGIDLVASGFVDRCIEVAVGTHIGRMLNESKLSLDFIQAMLGEMHADQSQRFLDVVLGVATQQVSQVQQPQPGEEGQ